MEDFKLKFQTISNKKNKGKNLYSRFIDTHTLKLNFEDLLTEIENKSSQHHLLNNPTIRRKIEELQQQDIDLLELCNGHDVINILSLALEKAIGNASSSKKISGKQIEEELIIAYRLDDFETTQLFSDLQQWENDNACKLFQND